MPFPSYVFDSLCVQPRHTSIQSLGGLPGAAFVSDVAWRVSFPPRSVGTCQGQRRGVVYVPCTVYGVAAEARRKDGVFWLPEDCL